MNVYYQSTRGGGEKVTASKAILMGLAEDGGLFVPDHLPKLDRSLEELAAEDYQECAHDVMKLLLTDYSEEELKECIAKAYDSKFDTPEIAPMAEAEGAYYLELFHGKTIAFKDMALSILPHLMITAARKNKDERTIVILTATSGDTGKAALAGFADVPGTKIIVFYPKDGVSPIQKRQMITQTGSNTCVIGVDGNFDDCQTEVKRIFTDEAENRKLSGNGYRFSSANSINIGRLVPQIVYYVYAYTRLVREGRIKAGDPVNFCVPTGNFGNILAAYYAGQMGIPVHKLICASNSNRVLYDFFTTGTYDRNRRFVLTMSPSMDILVSSNLERLIYHIAGDDAGKNAELMKELSAEGKYSITPEMREKLRIFTGGYASEEDTAEAIRSLYEDTGYVIDPHTAVARHVYQQYAKESGDRTPTVIASTASPFKFETSVLRSLGQPAEGDDLALADALSRIANVPVPEAVESLRGAAVRHTKVTDRAGMEREVSAFLGI